MPINSSSLAGRELVYSTGWRVRETSHQNVSGSERSSADGSETTANDCARDYAITPKRELMCSLLSDHLERTLWKAHSDRKLSTLTRAAAGWNHPALQLPRNYHRRAAWLVAADVPTGAGEKAGPFRPGTPGQAPHFRLANSAPAIGCGCGLSHTHNKTKEQLACQSRSRCEALEGTVSLSACKRATYNAV